MVRSYVAAVHIELPKGAGTLVVQVAALIQATL
jgi:ribonuclease HIII